MKQALLGGGVVIRGCAVVTVGMDSVEPPLPVAKVAATDGFGNPASGDSGPRFSGGGGVGDFGGLSIPFDRGSLDKDATYPTPSLKRNSASRAKGDGPKNVIVSAKNERDGKSHCTGEIRSSVFSSPKHEYQHTEKKSIKRLVSSPCTKRSRTDQNANPTNPGINRCSLSDKSQAFGQKNAMDGKRCDKKKIRVLGKSKFDSSASKNSSASFDACYGKNVLGIYGLKMDSQNVTKDLDNLSLTELLDDSYRRPSLFQDKGKRCQNLNDGILLSVKKSYSILPFHGSTNSQGKKSIPSPSFANDHNGEAKSIEKLSILEKNEILRKSQLYLPNDIMKRLKLPIAPGLDSLLQDTNIFSSAPLNDINVTENAHNASLPPFTWSSFHSGMSKLNADACRCISNRNLCQNKWVRIKSSPGSDLHGEVHVYGGDSSNQQNPKQLLEDVKNLIMDFSLPCHRITNEPCTSGNNIESHTLDDEISSVGIGGLSLDGPFDATPPSVGKISSDNHQMYGYNGLTNRKKEAQSGMQYHEDISYDPSSSSSNFGFCGTTVHNMEKSAGVPCNFIQTDSYLKNSDGWKQLSTCKIGKPVSGQCPLLLAAAEVLCELTRHTDSSTKCKNSSEKIKCQDKPSEINVKSNESRPSAGNRERLFMATMSSGTKRTSGQTSLKHLPVMSGKKAIDKEHRKLNAASVEAGIPARRFFKKSSTEMNLYLPPIRIEQRDDFHQDFKKRVSSNSYAITGTYREDLSRGKSRRL